MGKMFDGPIRLDDRTFTTPEILGISGVPDRSLRNWQHRKLLQVGERHFTGRWLFSIEDAIRLSAMHDLTVRVPLGPTDAAGAAEFVVRQVVKHAPRDEAGHPLFDLASVPVKLALALAAEDGEIRGGLIDPTQPGYSASSGPWARAHVVLPIAGLLADLAYRLIEYAGTHAPEAV